MTVFEYNFQKRYGILYNTALGYARKYFNKRIGELTEEERQHLKVIANDVRDARIGKVARKIKDAGLDKQQVRSWARYNLGISISAEPDKIDYVIDEFKKAYYHIPEYKKMGLDPMKFSKYVKYHTGKNIKELSEYEVLEFAHIYKKAKKS